MAIEFVFAQIFYYENNESICIVASIYNNNCMVKRKRKCGGSCGWFIMQSKCFNIFYELNKVHQSSIININVRKSEDGRITMYWYGDEIGLFEFVHLPTYI